MRPRAGPGRRSRPPRPEVATGSVITGTEPNPVEMRIIVILLALIVVLGWLGFELRDRSRDLSLIFFALSGLFALLLVGAFFGLYGA